MAITHNEVQIQWSAANSLSIAATGNGTSDVVSINTAAFQGSVSLKVDNDGTPASGDHVDFFILYSGGDPDGAGADEYDTTGHGQFLARLDTNDEDPAIRTVPIIVSPETGFKIYAVNNSAGRAITVSATYSEVRG